MRYAYLRGLPARILPKAEIVLIEAEREYPLLSHGGLGSAVRDATGYAVTAFCRCADLLCDAVADGDLAYAELSSQLDFLRRALIRDAYARSDVVYWRQFERDFAYWGQFGRDDCER